MFRLSPLFSRTRASLVDELYLQLVEVPFVTAPDYIYRVIVTLSYDLLERSCVSFSHIMPKDGWDSALGRRCTPELHMCTLPLVCACGQTIFSLRSCAK